MSVGCPTVLAMTNAWDAVRAAIDAEDFCTVATLLAAASALGRPLGG